MRALLLDVRPLRAPGFRALWMGSLGQGLGHQLGRVAVLTQVWVLTEDPFWTGALGLAHGLPVLVAGLAGGALADSVDRRRLVVWTTLCAGVLALGLAAQAAATVDALWLVFVLVALQGGVNALGTPSRRALVPALVPRDEVAAGVALVTATFQATMLLGPALGALVIARFGVAAGFAAEAIAFGLAAATLRGLPRLEAARSRARRGLRAVREGIVFVRRRPVLWGSLATDVAATLLAMPVALFPALATDAFGGDPALLGLFLSALAAGGVVATAFSGAVTRLPALGQVQIVASALWGVALVGAGLSASVALALAFLAVAGAADSLAVIARSAVLQLGTPDRFRGRASALEQIIGVAGPEVGNFRAGLMAGFLSPGHAIAAGGALAALGVIAVAAANRPLRRFRGGGRGTAIPPSAPSHATP